MVVFEAFGLAAAELFNYNREIYKFDQEQRIEKDMRRIEMQIKRFNLFREDIEDLVRLTVSKMDMYHTVGALMILFTAIIWTEGRFWGIGEPIWFVGAYYMYVLNSFVYLLLAVWLSMHASIQSQSYGVRLRTRFVRLPIPSLSVITDLTARFADFERQGLSNFMRLPFSGAEPAWKRREQLETTGQETQVRRPAEWREAGAEAGLERGTGSGELLGPGGGGFGTEDILAKAAGTVPGRHVQLFRRLQAKWNCYDAYARVSMSIGVRQVAQSVNMFVIGSTLIERRMPALAIAATLVFQTLTFGVSLLDMVDRPLAQCRQMSRGTQVLLVQLVGSAPIILILVLLLLGNYKRCRVNGAFYPIPAWHAAPLIFFLQAAWFQLQLVAAWPSEDEATLPRKFLAVLFLDVFGGAAYDPTEAEQAPVVTADAPEERERTAQETRIAAAEEALETAQAALRRWEAIPRELLSEDQREQLDKQRESYSFWRGRLQSLVVQRKAARGVAYDFASRDEQELRSWFELSDREQQEDQFIGTVLGPLSKRRLPKKSTYYYDLDSHRHVLDTPEGRPVLTLNDVSGHIDCVKAQVQSVFAKAASSESLREQEESTERESTAVMQAPDPLSASKSKRSVRVERLPWKILRRLTFGLQVGWVFLGLQLVLEDAGLWPPFGDLEPSCPVEWGHIPESKRRLAFIVASDSEGRIVQANVSELQATWPHGGFFRPTGMSCLQSASAALVLLIDTPYAVYRASVPKASSSKPIDMVVLPRDHFPPGSVALCKQEEPSQVAGNESSACWLGVLTQDGVALWQFGGTSTNASVLPFEGRPWAVLAGAALRCDSLASHVLVPSNTTWCLVLAGWDGGQITVAVIPVADSAPMQPVMVVASAVRPRFSVPLELAESGGDSEEERSGLAVDAVVALHLDPNSGLLRALLHDSVHGVELQAWSVVGLPRSLGRSRPLGVVAADGAFEATAMCADSNNELWLAGLEDQEERPQLFRMASV